MKRITMIELIGLSRICGINFSDILDECLYLTKESSNYNKKIKSKKRKRKGRK